MSNQYFKTSSEENTKALKLPKSDEMFSLPPWLLRRTWQMEQIDLSSSDFEKILHSAGFVDKTLLIREFVMSCNPSVITAPRKFGKSTNADMLRRFLAMEVDENGNRIPNDRSDNYRLFTSPIPGTNPPCKLKISQDEEVMEKYLGTHPVIYLKFQRETINSEDDAIAACRRVVHEAFKDHRYLINSPKCRDFGMGKYCEEWCSETEYMSFNDFQTVKGLQTLSSYLFHHHEKRCFVICDDYDIVSASSCISRVENSLLEKIDRNFLGCLDCLCDQNEYVKKCFITGTILYRAAKGMFHDYLDRVILCDERFLENRNLSEFFGLTLDELQMLKTRFFLEDSEFDDLIKYYNGYYKKYSSFGSVNLLNVYSVMSYLKYRRFDRYWCKLEARMNLSDALKNCCVRSAVLRMIGGTDGTFAIERCRVYSGYTAEAIKEILENPKECYSNNLFHFMLQLGYFTYSKVVKNEGSSMLLITIPNNEIQLNFIEKLKENYQLEQSVDFELVKECTTYWNSLDFSDASVVKENLKKICRILNDIFSKIKIEKLDKVSCHEILFVTLLDNKFACKSEGLSHDYYNQHMFDFLLEFKDCRIIMELKYRENSLNALKDIIDRKYCDNFDKNNVRVNHYVLLGINVSDKKEITMHALLDKKEMTGDLMNF